jgi:hypothetical protein
MSTTKQASMSGGCLMLFALPFAGVGVGMAIWLGWSLTDFVRMQRWRETPAMIIQANLESHRGSKGGTTYQTTAQYSYRYEGHNYRGNRVAIVGGSDNVGTYQQDMHRELQSYAASHKPFRCYVNPDRPSQSILYPKLRWEMATFQTIFMLAFGGVGFGLLAGGALGMKRTRRMAALAVLYPGEPWRWRDAWADGQIRSSRLSLAVSLVAAAAWNLLAAPLWLLALPEVKAGNRWALLGLIIPGIGVLLALWAVISVLRWLKYHESVFQMAAVPGVIGGRLAGVVRTSHKLAPEDGFHLKLTCVNRITTRSGNNTSTSEQTVWEYEETVVHELAESDPDRSAIPVLFQIPYDCRPTDDENADNRIFWRLEARAKVPGLDYRARFEVPIFKTPQSDPNFQPDPNALSEYLAPPDPQAQLREAGVRREPSPTGEGWRFVFPLGRNLSAALGWMMIALVFSGATVFLAFQAPFFFPIVFGLVSLVLLAVTQDLFFYRSVVDVSPRGLSVCGGPLGLGRLRWIDAANVTGIESVSHMWSNNARYYDVEIVCADGKRVTAGKRILGNQRAELVVTQIQETMNLRKSA